MCFPVNFAKACNFIKKETLAHVFSCEFSEISRNTFSYRTPPVDASEELLSLEPFKNRINKWKPENSPSKQTVQDIR